MLRFVLGKRHSNLKHVCTRNNSTHWTARGARGVRPGRLQFATIHCRWHLSRYRKSGPWAKRCTEVLPVEVSHHGCKGQENLHFASPHLKRSHPFDPQRSSEGSEDRIPTWVLLRGDCPWRSVTTHLLTSPSKGMFLALWWLETNTGLLLLAESFVLATTFCRSEPRLSWMNRIALSCDLWNSANKSLKMKDLHNLLVAPQTNAPRGS